MNRNNITITFNQDHRLVLRVEYPIMDLPHFDAKQQLGHDDWVIVGDKKFDLSPLHWDER